MSTFSPGAWLRLLRVSNLPTVLSNALTGCAISVPLSSPYPWRTFAWTAPALALIYSAGMALNDALDVPIDRQERPNRPIPSGAVSRSGAVVFAVFANAAALALLAPVGIPAILVGASLVVCAVLYNLVHRLHPASVVLMGACRALAIATGAAGAGWPPDWRWLTPIAGLLWVYVIALSLVARSEAARPRRIPVVVVMVCGISLLDAAALCVLSRWVEAGLAVGCFLGAIGAQRRIVGT